MEAQFDTKNKKVPAGAGATGGSVMETRKAYIIMSDPFHPHLSQKGLQEPEQNFSPSCLYLESETMYGHVIFTPGTR